MNTYLITYQWYENTSTGIIKANTEDEALLLFAKNICKLENNFKLERKYGYGGSISPFHYDNLDEEISFEEKFNKFLNNSEENYRDLFTIIKLTENTIGVITDKGFYNGEELEEELEEEI